MTKQTSTHYRLEACYNGEKWTLLRSSPDPSKLEPSEACRKSWPNLRIVRCVATTEETEHTRWRNGVLVGRARTMEG